MIRYPIFEFHFEKLGSRLFVYHKPDDWAYLEVYDLDHLGTLLDSDGRVLQAEDAGNERLNIYDPGGEPDPERLRQALIQFLTSRNQQVVEANAPLETLISSARALLREEKGWSIGKWIVGFLRFLHWKNTTSQGPLTTDLR